MKTTLVRKIELNYDSEVVFFTIEIHYNSNLNKKPYLVKVFNFKDEDYNELRLEKKEIDDLYRVLKTHKLI